MKKHSLLLLSLLSCVTFGLSSCSVNKNEIQDNNNNHNDDDKDDQDDNGENQNQNEDSEENLRFVDFKTIKVSNGVLTYEVAPLKDAKAETINLFIEGYYSGEIKPLDNLKGEIGLYEAFEYFFLKAEVTYKTKAGVEKTKTEKSKTYHNTVNVVSFNATTKHIEDNIYSLDFILNPKPQYDVLFEYEIKDLELYNDDALVQKLENKSYQEIVLNSKQENYRLSYEVSYRTENMGYYETIKDSINVMFDIPNLNIDDFQLKFEPLNIEGTLYYKSLDSSKFEIEQIQAIDKDGNIVDTNGNFEGHLHNLIIGETYTLRVKLTSKYFMNCSFVKDFTYVAKSKNFNEDKLIGVTSTDNKIILDYKFNEEVFFKNIKTYLYHGEELIQTINDSKHVVFNNLVPGNKYKLVSSYDFSSTGIDFASATFTREINTTINGNSDFDIYFDKLIKENNDIIYSIKSNQLEGHDYFPTGLRIYKDGTLVEGQVYDALEGRVTNLPPDEYELRLYFEGHRADGSFGEKFKEVNMNTRNSYAEPAYEFNITYVDEDRIRYEDDKSTGPFYLTLKNDPTPLVRDHYEYTYLIPSTTYTAVKEFYYYNTLTKSFDIKKFTKDITTLPKLARIHLKYCYVLDGYLNYEFVADNNSYSTATLDMIYLTDDNYNCMYLFDKPMKGKIEVPYTSTDIPLLTYHYKSTYKGVSYSKSQERINLKCIDDLNFTLLEKGETHASFTVNNYISSIYSRNITEIEFYDQSGLVDYITYEIKEDRISISGLKNGSIYNIKVKYSTDYLPLYELEPSSRIYETSIDMTLA